jgi:hypothetical protein
VSFPPFASLNCKPDFSEGVNKKKLYSDTSSSSYGRTFLSKVFLKVKGCEMEVVLYIAGIMERSGSYGGDYMSRIFYL